jgi:predicted PurR-regulated permease PerM
LVLASSEPTPSRFHHILDTTERVEELEVIEPRGEVPPVPAGKSAPPSPYRLIVFGCAVGVLAVAAALLVWRLRAVFLLVGMGLFLALVLVRPVDFLESKGMRRSIATFLVFFLFSAVLAGLVAAVLVPAYSGASRLVSHLPSLVREAEAGRGAVGSLAKKLHLLKYVQRNQRHLEDLVGQLGKPALAVGKSVLSAFVSGATIFFLAYFMVLEGPSIGRRMLRALPERQAGVLARIIPRAISAVTGYIAGRLIIAGVTLAAVLVALVLLGVPYPLPLSIWAGMVNFLPIVGGFLGGVVVVSISFLHSTTAGIVMLIVFVAQLEAENHVLVPVVLSRTVRLNPLWVLLAALFGAEIGAVIGGASASLALAIVAIPLAGVVEVTLEEIARDRFHQRGPAEDEAEEGCG